MPKKALDEKATDKLAETIGPSDTPDPERAGHGIPGPSTNPATNLIIADIAMRGVGRVARTALQKGMLRAGFDEGQARKIADDRTMLSSILLYGASRIATRSIPGAALVGGGLLLKTLYDRGESRRTARLKGEKTLKAMTSDDANDAEK
jgi:hypothetical protein